MAARRSFRPGKNVRWVVIWADIRNFFGRLPTNLRKDPTAVMLVVANIYPVVDLLVKGDPVGSLMIIYWIQLMILGFFNAIKLAVLARWKALFIVPMFLAMYLSLVNIFGFIAGGLLDDQMRGTTWVEAFSLWNYWVPATVFFVNHGLSFYLNFIKGREYEGVAWDVQMGKPFLRVMPMWIAALAGGVVGGFLNSAAWALAFVLPVKLTLDVLGHFVEHGKLGLDEHPSVSLWRE